MKIRFYLFLLLCSQLINVWAQDDRIFTIMNSIELDSLVKHVRILSGEDSVQIDNSKYLIKNRSYNNPGNEIAAKYFQKKMIEYGLDVRVQRYSLTGENIYAIQQGKVFPDEYYIICAHYDAVTDYAADDNASGCAAVLESARILSNFETDRSIIYAFWDEEEIGLIGSGYFADSVASESMNIKGVINLEMFGWDSDNDNVFDLHLRDIADTYKFGEIISSVIEDYDIELTTYIIDPGVDASDHSSFWDHNYSVLVFGESFFGGDGNPNDHLPTDRINQFNLGYFHTLSKLAASVISHLAFYGIDNPTSNKEEPIIYEYSLNQNYPNPFNPSTTINFSIPQQTNVSLKVYDVLGKEVAELVNEEMSSGSFKVDFDASNLSSGIYFYTLRTNEFFKTKKMLVLK